VKCLGVLALRIGRRRWRDELVHEEDGVHCLVRGRRGHRAGHTSEQLIPEVKDTVVRERPVLDQRAHELLDALCRVGRLAGRLTLLGRCNGRADRLTEGLVRFRLDRHHGGSGRARSNEKEVVVALASREGVERGLGLDRGAGQREIAEILMRVERAGHGHDAGPALRQ
jgi:hypothetical protein